VSLSESNASKRRLLVSGLLLLAFGLVMLSVSAYLFWELAS
jgi:hypothetical protein